MGKNLGTNYLALLVSQMENINVSKIKEVMDYHHMAPSIDNKMCAVQSCP